MTNGSETHGDRTRRRIASAAALAAGALWSTGAGATGPEVNLSLYHGVELLAVEEMGGLRGGFINAFGVPIQFGADVLTTIDGMEVFRTSFVLTETGFESSIVFVPDPTVDLTGMTSIEIPGGTVVELVGGDTGVAVQDLMPTGVDLSGLNGTAGFVLVDETGATAVLHDVAADRLVNVIANTASGLDIRQELEATITLDNLGDFQSDVRLEQLRMELGRL